MKQYQLFIDTVTRQGSYVAIKQVGQIVADLFQEGSRNQAEQLLASVIKLLAENKIKLSEITQIEVVNVGGSFTSLRIGVVVANALAYGLGIEVKGSDGQFLAGLEYDIVEPQYSSEPSITIKKEKK